MGDPEGKLIIGSETVVTDANGDASGSTTVGTVPLNTPITATATNISSIKFGVNSNTSEFSPPFIYGVANPCPIVCSK